MDVIPMPGWIVVRKEEDTRKIGGLDMPDSAKDKELTKGTVVAAGEGTGITQAGGQFEIPLGIIGDRVVYKKYSDHPLDDEELKLVHFENVMAIIN